MSIDGIIILIYLLKSQNNRLFPFFLFDVHELYIPMPERNKKISTPNPPLLRNILNHCGICTP